MDCSGTNFSQCGDDGTYDIEVPVPCQFQEGQDIIDFYAMDKDLFVFDIMMLVLMFFIFRIAGLVALFLRARRKNK